MVDNTKVGLALSGGGYRAAAFHLGTLRALHKMGLLNKVDVISSVSGGSIIAAYYALHKDEPFELFEKGLRKGLSHCSLWGSVLNVMLVLTTPAILIYWLSSWWWGCLYLLLLVFGFKFIPSSKWIALMYDLLFFKRKRLNDLPDEPVIGINSTNIVKGRLFTFSKQDVGGFDYKEEGESIINGEDIRISFAVSSSTCVPSFFSPTRIKKSYFVDGKFKDTLLVDGGLYDNQGAYILTESTNWLYKVKNVIVSDAGNSEPNSKRIHNTFCLMSQSIEVLMNRIRTMQLRKNIYQTRYDINDKHKYDSEPNFAYLSLRWDEPEGMVERFLNNIKQCHIPRQALEYHKIANEDIKLFVEEKNEEAKNRIAAKFITSIQWKELSKSAPSKKTYDLAYRVSTNLIPLSEEKVDALSAYAEWLTELQVKTYLPYLLKNK